MTGLERQLTIIRERTTVNSHIPKQTVVNFRLKYFDQFEVSDCL